MTREEREAAIAYIKGYRKLDEDLHNTAPKDSISYYATDKCLKYWDMAIKALSQEPCEDAISREAAIKLCTNDKYNIQYKYEDDKGITHKGYDEYRLIDYYKLKQLPSVQPSRKGHWIEVEKYSDGKHKIECSECGNYIFDRGHANSHNVKEKYKYCNYCGADMRGTE